MSIFLKLLVSLLVIVNAQNVDNCNWKGKDCEQIIQRTMNIYDISESCKINCNKIFSNLPEHEIDDCVEPCVEGYYERMQMHYQNCKDINKKNQ